MFPMFSFAGPQVISLAGANKNVTVRPGQSLGDVGAMYSQDGFTWDPEHDDITDVLLMMVVIGRVLRIGVLRGNIVDAETHLRSAYEYNTLSQYHNSKPVFSPPVLQKISDAICLDKNPRMVMRSSLACDTPAPSRVFGFAYSYKHSTSGEFINGVSEVHYMQRAPQQAIEVGAPVGAQVGAQVSSLYPHPPPPRPI